jgi:hypothetical protein
MYKAKLKTLRLASAQLSGDDLKLLGHMLQTNQSLQYLDLSNNAGLNQAYTVLCSTVRPISRLTLQSCFLQNRNFRHLFRDKHAAKLCSIQIQNCIFTDSALQSFHSELAQLHGLRHFEMSFCLCPALEEELLCLIQGLRCLKSLLSLKFNFINLTSDFIDNLRGMLCDTEDCHLATLDLSHNTF